jgi:ribosomal protein S5
MQIDKPPINKPIATKPMNNEDRSRNNLGSLMPSAASRKSDFRAKSFAAKTSVPTGAKPASERPTDNKDGSRRFNRPSELETFVITQKFVSRTRAGGRERRKVYLVGTADAKTHKLGIGKGKASTAPVAIKKAEYDAARNMIQLKVAKFKNNTVVTVPQPIIYTNHGVTVMISQNNVAGQLRVSKVLKDVFAKVGYTSLVVKIRGNGSIKNQLDTCIEALSMIETAAEVAKRLSVPVNEIKSRHSAYIKRNNVKGVTK